MSKTSRAMKALFSKSDKVTCSACGKDLTQERNLPRLIRLGCPACGCQKFDYEVNQPEAQAAIQGILGAPHVG